MPHLKDIARPEIQRKKIMLFRLVFFFFFFGFIVKISSCKDTVEEKQGKKFFAVSPSSLNCVYCGWLALLSHAYEWKKKSVYSSLSAFFWLISPFFFSFFQANSGPDTNGCQVCKLKFPPLSPSRSLIFFFRHVLFHNCSSSLPAQNATSWMAST